MGWKLPEGPGHRRNSILLDGDNRGMANIHASIDAFQQVALWHGQWKNGEI